METFLKFKNLIQIQGLEKLGSHNKNATDNNPNKIIMLMI